MPGINVEVGRIGQYRDGAGTFFEEFVKELQGKRGIEVYKEMANNDDTIGAILFAIEMLIRQCSFTVEPGGDTETDKKAAEFVEQCMDDMEFTWTDTISEIISFITYGWSYHEIVYKVRRGKTKNPVTRSKYNDGLIGWRKLPIRAQDTLFEWHYKEGTDDLEGMEQIAPPDFNNCFIPIGKALHFKTKSAKGNPEGKSVLRNAYRSWFFKKRIQEIEGIGIERDLAGFPTLTGPEDVDLWDNNDEDMKRALANAEKIVTGVRRDSKEGLVLPFGWKFELVSTGSRRQFDTNQIIERYDKRMAMTVLADFIFMGQQAVGSFALSDNKTELFSLAIGTFLDVICETFNSQGIPRLIDLNESHFKGITDYPKMKHGDIEEEDITKLSTFLKDMISVGVLVPDEELEDFVRLKGGLPDRPEGAPRDYQAQANETPGNGSDGLPGPGNNEAMTSTEMQSVYKITSIIEKYQKGILSRDICLKLLAKIGLDDNEIKEYMSDADVNAEKMKEKAAEKEKQKPEKTPDEKEAEEAKKSLGRA